MRLASTDNDNIPTFNPENSGTATQPIVYVTKFAATALDNLPTNPHRTQLRHDGTRPYGSGGREQGTGSPMYGVNGRDHIIYDGFYLDVTEAWSCGDCGIIRAENATGVEFRNFVLKGTTVNMESNATMIRTHNTVNVAFRNLLLLDWANDPTGSNVPQQGFAWIGYGDQNYLFTNFELINTQRGLFSKGAPGGIYNYGTIQYGRIRQRVQCFQFNATHPTNLTRVHHNLCEQYTGAGVRISSETDPMRNMLIDHNTFARANGAQYGDGLYARPGGFSGMNVTIRDNIIDRDAGSGSGHLINYGETSTLPNVQNYNGYYQPSGGYYWSWNRAGYSSLSAWRNATNRDLNSRVLSSDPFMNRASGDYRLVNGYEAKTASSTGGEIGAYGDLGSNVIGLDITGSSSHGGSGSNNPP